MNADELFSPANRRQPVPRLSPTEERESMEHAANAQDNSDDDPSDDL